MSLWVLPNILTVDDVVDLDDRVLKLFSEISTGIITMKVNDFVSKNSQSNNPMLAKAANKLYTAFYEVNRASNYLESEEAKNLADSLVSLQYSDISATTDIVTLRNYRKLIIELLAEDADFLNSYTGEVEESDTRGLKTSYTMKLDGDHLQVTLDRMRAMSTDNMPLVYKLCSTVESNKTLFKNGSMSTNKATVLRKAFYKKDKLKAILKGLDYLIPKIEAGVSPYSWRRL